MWFLMMFLFALLVAKETRYLRCIIIKYTFEREPGCEWGRKSSTRPLIGRARVMRGVDEINGIPWPACVFGCALKRCPNGHVEWG